MLEHEPAVGLAIVDGQAKTVACNQRFTALTAPAKPDRAGAKAAPGDRSGVWSRVGPEAVRTAAAKRHAAVLHFIHDGKQVQCDVWPLAGELAPPTGQEPGREPAGEPHREPAGPPLFLVLAVEGRFEPAGHAPSGGPSESHTAGGPADPHFTTLAPLMAELGALGALTARELEVLAFIGTGMATREIAQALGRSPRTVERHCDAIHKKLGTSNRVHMASYAMQAGLTPQAGKLKRV
jgi:DNA-binding CsgD family transcriptional regulator